MFAISKIFFLISLHNYVVQGLIPTLKVNKLDRKLIARKRQDTLEMCRIFTVENEKLLRNNRTLNDVPNPYRTKLKSRRTKRSLMETVDDAKRVEKIVDQLYDDVLENGEKVVYRHKEFNKNVSLPSNPEVPMSEIFLSENIRNITVRRFNFAPALLLGPESKDHSILHNDSSDPIPWHKKWRHGIVPFFIDYKTYDSHLAEIITKAFDYFERATCIRLQRLRERPTDRQSLQGVEWLYISNPLGIRQCVHSNHRKPNSGVQVIVFGYDCLSLGEIVHEVMHILGFAHEHTRPDRDQHITILWDNIKPGYRKYFEIRSDEAFIHSDYDLASVLHYPPRAFSKNGQQTILAKSGVKLGQRDGLSTTDIQKIERIFGNECAQRNKQYLMETCPVVVKSAKKQEKNITQRDIEDYFKERLWPYGVINYKLRDAMDFSVEERENIKAVIRHIEKETCIEFRDQTAVEEDIAYSAHQNKSDSDKKGKPLPHESENEINAEHNKNGENVTELESSELNGQNRSILRSKEFTTVTVTSKRVRLDANSLASRRHSDSVLVLTWSPKNGCTCPEPGRPNEKQELEISSDCFNSVNDLLHLFVHVLGLDHQHNMHDRDSYLHILWKNLSEDVKKEMQIKLPPAASVGFPYDYRSVMHYPWLQIKDGVTNIMYPIWNDGWAMGHWQGLSSTDVQKINLLYYEQCLERRKEANL